MRPGGSGQRSQLRPRHGRTGCVRRSRHARLVHRGDGRGDARRRRHPPGRRRLGDEQPCECGGGLGPEESGIRDRAAPVAVQRVHPEPECHAFPERLSAEAAMKISLVIPTRERAEYLAGSLDTALSVDDPDFEIVVSDNCSQDDTAEVVAARSDPRLHYVRTSERCSMRANFENGLWAASGDYLIFIGDDDGVLPSGVAYIRKLISRYHPEAVSWRCPCYYWPAENRKHPNGSAYISRRALYRRPWQQTPSAILSEICASRMGCHSFHRHAQIYHGCISRKLVERVCLIQEGVYFRGAIPDVYSGIANLRAMSDPLLWAGYPATIAGASPRSNGKNQMTFRKTGKMGQDEIAAFKEEASGDKGAGLIDVNIPSVDALALDMLDLALAGQPEHDEIHWEAWLRRIRQHLVKMPRQHCLYAEEALEVYCRAKGLSVMLSAINSELPFSGPEDMLDERIPPQKSRLKLHSIRLSDSVELGTVAGAARTIEEVLGPYASHRTSRAKWFGALLRARRATRRWLERTNGVSNS